MFKDNTLVFIVRLRLQPGCSPTVNRLRSVYPKSRLWNPGSNNIFVSFSKRPDRLSDPPSLLLSRSLGAIFPGVYGWGVKLPLTALSAKVKKKKKGVDSHLHSLKSLYGVQQGLLYFILSCVVDPTSFDFSCLADKCDERKLSVVSNVLLYGKAFS